MSFWPVLNTHLFIYLSKTKTKKPRPEAWVTIKQLMLLQVTQSILILFVFVLVFSLCVPSSIVIYKPSLMFLLYHTSSSCQPPKFPQGTSSSFKALQGVGRRL